MNTKTEKTTSKREFRFVIHGTEGRVTIVNDNNEQLRSFVVDKLPKEIRDILIVHGLKQKLTDDTMVSKIGEDGDRLLACDDLWTRLAAGEWEKEREGIARPPEAIVVFVMERKRVAREVAIASLKQVGKAGWDGIAKANTADIEAIAKRLKSAEAVSLDDMS